MCGGSQDDLFTDHGIAGRERGREHGDEGHAAGEGARNEEVKGMISEQGSARQAVSVSPTRKMLLQRGECVVKVWFDYVPSLSVWIFDLVTVFQK